MPQGRKRSGYRRSGWASLVLAGLGALTQWVAFCTVRPAHAGEPRIDELERRLDAVVEENQRLAQELRHLREDAAQPARSDESSNDSPMPPGTDETPGWALSPHGYSTGYDRGIFIRPDDLDDSPYSLKINHQAMFRYAGFDRAITSWTNSAGDVTPIDPTFRTSRFHLPGISGPVPGRPFLRGGA